MKNLFTPPIVIAICAASPVFAGEAFGTDAEARDVAGRMVEIVADGGTDAGIAAMHDPIEPFTTSQMGIHLFEQSIIVADNREPELIASSYAEIADLTGDIMWPRITAAADVEGDAILEWYHYDTEAEYTYNCYSQWAVADDVLVMVCR
ncbi:hypothetical protein N9W17_05075 [Jannaschia sp.]|nr:hypothetical protein [Jannaschia sp.]